MTETNNTKGRFDVLFGTLCEIQKGLLENTVKVAGFSVIAIGWLATSDYTQRLLRADKTLRYLVVAATGGAFALYVVASLKAFAISQQSLSLLNKLNFMPLDYYKNRSIDAPVLIVYIAGNLFLSLLVALLVLRMR